MWAFLREKLGEGRQAYVVYPRVEETGANGVKAVTREFETVAKAMAPFRSGLLHGRLKAREKEEVMAAFRLGAVHVLLATSRVEVGVDVPNATLMLIENAEQFGLAQLHQLRGRIGRGAHDSYCILLSAAARNKEAQQRLKVLEETTDGFRIAEADLELRGPGEFLGHQQSGAPKFRFGDLTRDGGTDPPREGVHNEGDYVPGADRFYRVSRSSLRNSFMAGERTRSSCKWPPGGGRIRTPFNPALRPGSAWRLPGDRGLGHDGDPESISTARLTVSMLSNSITVSTVTPCSLKICQSALRVGMSCSKLTNFWPASGPEFDDWSLARMSADGR